MRSSAPAAWRSERASARLVLLGLGHRAHQLAEHAFAALHPVEDLGQHRRDVDHVLDQVAARVENGC